VCIQCRLNAWARWAVGPLLFIIFINGLPLVLQNVYADLYADDTTLHKSSSSVSVLDVELNTDLYNVVEGCHENNMVLNTEKNKLMLIGSIQRHLVNETDVKIKVDEDNFISSVKTEKTTRYIHR
jgi:hypothetical protein